MLPRQNTADLDAQTQNIVAELFGTIEFAGHVGVIEDQRMQVAVARMKHIGYAETVFLRQRFHPPQHFRKPSARNRSVHAIIIRRDTPHCWKRSLAPSPKCQTFALVSRNARRDRAVLSGDPRNLLDEMFAFG